VCIFSTGLCAQACSGDVCDSCGQGFLCNGCATSSCPDCADCKPACVPLQSGQCDEDDPCTTDMICVFSLHYCAKRCMGDDECNSLNEYCEQCATGSCCGCDDCVGACLGGE
jgi:hypothetical protein